MQLYGFADRAERELFVQLLTVNGIGPKVALAIVSGSPPEELRRAIVREDTARFQIIPGIGKKTAERIVLELKEKMGDGGAGARRGRLERRARGRARRARRARLHARRRGARAGGHGSGPSAGGSGAARVEEGRMSTQFLAPLVKEEDEELEQTLRPRSLADFVGQERVKEQLGIALAAAKARGEALDHVLLVGPPGLGKTSLAYIVREELGVGIRAVAGPALERKDIAAILTSLEDRDVVFVDEIHRMSRAAEEILYPALEDFRLDIVMGQGAAARTLTLDLPPFTLVGATTRTGLLTSPLRDRFGMTFRLDYYEPGQLGHDRAPLGADPRRRDRRRRGRRDRRSRARHAADREPDPAPRPRRRAGASPGLDHDAGRARGAGAARGGRSRARADRPRPAPHDRRQVRRRPGRSVARSPSRWARSRTRSRTSTSRSCCSSASSSARRAAARSRSSAAPTSAPPRPIRTAGCSEGRVPPVPVPVSDTSRANRHGCVSAMSRRDMTRCQTRYAEV